MPRPGDDVEGQEVLRPSGGFGQLWRKHYAVTIARPGLSPEDVITHWKEHFSHHWPPGNRFFKPAQFRPGESAHVDLELTPGATISTAVQVVESRPDAFTLLTPQGHVLAGVITCSAYREDSHLVASIRVILRASDPINELGLVFGGHRREDQFWEHTLQSLAAHFDAPDPTVRTTSTCIDPARQWRNAGNIVHNGIIRTTLRRLAWPLRALRSFFRERLPSKS